MYFPLYILCSSIENLFVVNNFTRLKCIGRSPMFNGGLDGFLIVARSVEEEVELRPEHLRKGTGVEEVLNGIFLRVENRTYRRPT